MPEEGSQRWMFARALRSHRRRRRVPLPNFPANTARNRMGRRANWDHSPEHEAARKRKYKERLGVAAAVIESQLRVAKKNRAKQLRENTVRARKQTRRARPAPNLVVGQAVRWRGERGERAGHVLQFLGGFPTSSKREIDSRVKWLAVDTSAARRRARELRYIEVIHIDSVI